MTLSASEKRLALEMSVIQDPRSIVKPSEATLEIQHFQIQKELENAIKKASFSD